MKFLNDIIISAKNINKSFGNSVHAVRDVNINIRKGEFLVIMGRSGSGKTTLLQLLSLLDNFDNGNLYINNINASELNDKEKALIRMKKFGFIFQSFYLNPKLKAYENVMLPMYLNGKQKYKTMKENAYNLLNSMGLNDRKHHFPKELSGGEQQRVAISRALANDPDCIFADEPTGNLDIDNEKLILHTLKQLSKDGKSIVVVSHNQSILDYADKIFFMEEGILEERVK